MLVNWAPAYGGVDPAAEAVRLTGGICHDRSDLRFGRAVCTFTRIRSDQERVGRSQGLVQDRQPGGGVVVAHVEWRRDVDTVAQDQRYQPPV